MDTITKILGKISQIEKLVIEIKKDLESLDIENQSTESSIVLDLPSEEDLIKEYDHLYDLFISGDQISIQEYIRSKNKTYLKAFCKANKFLLDASKASKEKIIEETLQWMRQRQAITKKEGNK